MTEKNRANIVQDMMRDHRKAVMHGLKMAEKPMHAMLTLEDAGVTLTAEQQETVFKLYLSRVPHVG
jgi:hypothetical protein